MSRHQNIYSESMLIQQRIVEIAWTVKEDNPIQNNMYFGRKTHGLLEIVLLLFLLYIYMHYFVFPFPHSSVQDSLMRKVTSSEDKEVTSQMLAWEI